MVFTTPTKRRKWFFCGVGIAAVVLVVWAAADFTYKVLHPVRASVVSDLSYYQNVTSPNKVLALTFDDGPDPEQTRAIMEVLDEHGVPATFFFLGSNALRHPEVVREIHKAGYEIGNHTYTHARSVHESPERLAFELSVTNEILKSITGEDTVIYRPPFLLNIGSDASTDHATPNPVQEWVAQSGYVFVGIDVDSLDWAARSPEEIVDSVLSGVEHGRMVLFHDSGAHTVEALRVLIPELIARGYYFAEASDLLGLTAYPQMHLAHTLALGATDAATQGEVTTLQTFLLMEGYLPRATTGIFDTETEAALAAWQAAEGVPEAGVAGALTHQRIAAVAAARTPRAPGGSGAPFLVQAGVSAVGIAAGVTRVLSQGVLLAFGLVLLRLVCIVALWVWRAWRVRHGTQALAPWRRSASVIVPVYNEEENIGATLQSILASAHPVGDVVVVDDGSTDGSAEVARTYVQRYPGRVRLIEQENGGKAAALMRGIKVAHGEVVVTVDADTILEREAVGLLLRHFNDPAVSAVSGRVCVIPMPGLLNRFQHMEYMIGQQVEKRLFAELNAVGVVPGPIGAWRKDALLAAGGYTKDTLVEDQDTTLAVLAAGGVIRYEPDALAYTEPPHTVQDFLIQRLRWTFGTLQCLWKYRSFLGELKRPNLGLLVLPHTLIFGVAVALIYPVIDLLFVVALITGAWQGALALYLCFVLADLLYAAVGLAGEPLRARLLLLLPIQRFFYRLVLYVVVLSSIAYAIEGAGLLWGKVRKRGEATAYQARLGQALVRVAGPLQRVIPESVTTSFQGPLGTSASFTKRQYTS